LLLFPHYISAGNGAVNMKPSALERLFPIHFPVWYVFMWHSHITRTLSNHTYRRSSHMWIRWPALIVQLLQQTLPVFCQELCGGRGLHVAPQEEVCCTDITWPRACAICLDWRVHTLRDVMLE